MSTQTFMLSAEEEQHVVKAIQAAELLTSAEIKVHLENYSDTPPLIKACAVFKELNMHQTIARNGILIYICVETKKFALYADTGISNIVHELFWETEKNTLIDYFKKGQYALGLQTVILDIAYKIKDYFPYKDNDANEISNEISKK